MRKRSDGFQPFSDYFESRQEPVTRVASLSAHSEAVGAESEALLDTARSSRRLGASINCSPIPLRGELAPMEEGSWRAVFEETPSAPARNASGSAPLHEKLRELLDENSRSFDQLRARRPSDAFEQAQKLKSLPRGANEPSSSISFRRSSSRLSRGPEPSPPPQPRPPSPPVNVFESSEPRQPEPEPEPEPQPEPAPPVRKRAKKAAKERGQSPPAKERRQSPPADGKKTVKTKNGPAPPQRIRAAKKPPRASLLFDVAPECRGVTLRAEEGRTGRYVRRRRYAPLLDFLFENVTRNADGDLRLHLAELKLRPEHPPPSARASKQPPPPLRELDGVLVELLSENDAAIAYRVRLAGRQVKPVAAAQLPVRLQAEGRDKRSVVVSSGSDPQQLRRTALGAGQGLDVPANGLYALENPYKRAIKLSLTVFKARG